MAIEGIIKTLLGPLVAGRCYPLVAPDCPVKPYIVYQMISEVPESNLDGFAGISRHRFQIDAYAASYGAVKALAGKKDTDSGSIKATMAAASIKSIHLSSRDLHEKDTKTFRVSMDFSIWS